MQKSDKHQATGARRKVQASTTLNRRYVRQPHMKEDMEVEAKEAAKQAEIADTATENHLEVKISHFNRDLKETEEAVAPEKAGTLSLADAVEAEENSQTEALAKEIWGAEIAEQSALEDAALQADQQQATKSHTKAAGLTSDTFADNAKQTEQQIKEQLASRKSKASTKPARSIKVQADTEEDIQKDLEAEVKAATRSTKTTKTAAKSAKTTKAAKAAKSRRTIKVHDEEDITPAKQHPLQQTAHRRMKSRGATSRQSKKSAHQLKNEAIQRALATSAKKASEETAKQEKRIKRIKMHFGIGRVVLALSCAAAAVAGIIYLVNTNMPDVSMQVAAIQTGIDASYPGYVPRGYTLSNLASEDGKVTLRFKSDESSDTYTLVEENSSWDSNALLANYVKPTYGDDYSIVKEQGLTIYVNDKGAAWVNGGVVYKLSLENAELTKKQIKSIAVSL